MEQLEQKLSGLQAELKAYFDKAADEKKNFGTMLDETKANVEALQKQADAIEAKLIERTVTEPEAKSLADELKENEEVSRLLRNRKGSVVITLSRKQYREIFERKTTVTSSAINGSTPLTVTGVLPIERDSGITAEARQALNVRSVLASRPTANQVVDFVKVASAPAQASPQVEASAKYENAVTFESVSERVRTLATWIPASKQILSDMDELLAYIMTALPYYVNLEEEEQLLLGDDTGENLNGLYTQATAFNTSLLVNSAGWNKIDILGRAVQQIMIAKEVMPTFALVNPKDLWDMRLQKDAEGRYLLGDPFTAMFGRRLFDTLQVVPTSTLSSGVFIVGSGNAVCSEIRDREDMTVEISTEHSDYFTKNLVAIRAEKRLTLVVKRPASYIRGTFTTSPA